MKLHLSYDQFAVLYTICTARIPMTRYELIKKLWMPSVASRISELRRDKNFNLPLINDSKKVNRKFYIASSLDLRPFREYMKTDEAKRHKREYLLKQSI